MGNESKNEKGRSLSKGVFSRSIQRRVFVLLLSSLGLISVFQNCAPGKVQSGTIDPTMKGFSSLAECSAQPTNPDYSQPDSLEAGNRVNGFLNSNALYPETCISKSVIRTCLESGKWDGQMPIFAGCVQQCIHPESTASNPRTSIQSEHYVTYTRSRGQNLAECNDAKVRIDSVCNADPKNPGTFYPPVPTTSYYKTCIVDPICPYNIDPGSAMPVKTDNTPTDTPRPGDSVTGYLNSSEIYPKLCSQMNKKMTCKTDGAWDFSAPTLYRDCVQNCVDPVTTKPVPQDTSIRYWTIKYGDDQECADALYTASCRADTGQFNPAVPATTLYAKCVLVNPPTINTFTADQGAVLEGGTVKLTWNVANFTTLYIYDENNNRTDVSNLTFLNVMPTLPLNTYRLEAFYSSDGFTSKPSTINYTVMVVKKPTPSKINAFDPNPAVITLGESTTFSWSVLDGTSLSLSDGTAAMDVSSATSVVVDSLKLSAVGKYNFTLTAYHKITVRNYGVDYTFSSDAVTSTKMVTVRPTPAKINTFTVDSPLILPTMKATLSWDVLDGTVLTLTDVTDPANPVPLTLTAGSTTYDLNGLMLGIHTYELSAIHRVNAIDSIAVTKTQTVEVVAMVMPAEIIRFEAVPAMISTNMTSQLSWEVLNGTMITLKDVTDPANPVQLTLAAGATTFDLMNLTVGIHTYELSAVHRIGMIESAAVTRMTTVTVVDPPTPATINAFTASPLTITTLGTSILSWDVTDGTVLTVTDITNPAAPVALTLTPGATSVSVSGLAIGNHTYELRAIHRVNMIDSVAVTSQQIVTVVSAALTINTFTADANTTSLTINKNSTVSFAWTATNGASFTLTYRKKGTTDTPISVAIDAGATANSGTGSFRFDNNTSGNQYNCVLTIVGIDGTTKTKTIVVTVN